MKPALQLRISQQLTMTPQLQQAIRLLQLSALDLAQEIQSHLEANPLLELEESPEDNPETTLSDNQLGESQQASEPEEVIEFTPDSWSADLSATAGRARDADSDAEYFGSAEETLHDHLRWQANLTPFSAIDALIAEALIDAIDDDGYLTVTTEEIAQMISSPDRTVEVDEVEAVLHRIQRFDPVGVGARTLTECLTVQLSELGTEKQEVNDAIFLAQTYLDELGRRSWQNILKKTGWDEARLRRALKLIQSMNPKPGATIAPSRADYVIPDVYVSKINGKWTAHLNPQASPRLTINDNYVALAKQSTTKEDSQFFKNHLQEAKWLIKSLQSRNDTLLRVAQEIVERQQGFFEYGEEAMRPMILADIAQAVDLHESTVSRVTTQKYLACPRGLFELKYFFSSHVATSSGGECSSTAIKALIKKLIDAEDPRKPLSDSKIAKLLKEQGIMVARRTVAKYREALNIPSSTERKFMT